MTLREWAFLVNGAAIGMNVMGAAMAAMAGQWWVVQAVTALCNIGIVVGIARNKE